MKESKPIIECGKVIAIQASYIVYVVKCYNETQVFVANNDHDHIEFACLDKEDMVHHFSGDVRHIPVWAEKLGFDCKRFERVSTFDMEGKDIS